ncbi:jg21989 [Pararge aegeria aegeria]|uniref:Jg21989 protein n=1 Tax=Pararge aegeria aegeria TaxID=348720 RepID=A0A8S4QQL5_9NEOP|nr:jg21989 [Pararge aegeria aegeria]
MGVEAGERLAVDVGMAVGVAVNEALCVGVAMDGGLAVGVSSMIKGQLLVGYRHKGLVSLPFIVVNPLRAHYVAQVSAQNDNGLGRSLPGWPSLDW